MPEKPDSPDGEAKKPEETSSSGEPLKPDSNEKQPREIRYSAMERLARRVAGITFSSNNPKRRFSSKPPSSIHGDELASMSSLLLPAINESDMVTYVRDSQDEETVKLRSFAEQIIRIWKEKPDIRKTLGRKSLVIKMLAECQGIAAFIGTHRFELSAFVLEQEYTEERNEAPSDSMTLSGFIYRLNKQLQKLLDEAEGKISPQAERHATATDEKHPKRETQESENDLETVNLDSSFFKSMSQAERWHLAQDLRQAIITELKQKPLNTPFIWALLRDLVKIEEKYFHDFQSFNPPEGINHEDANGAENEKLRQLLAAAEARAKRAEEAIKVDKNVLVELEVTGDQKVEYERKIRELKQEIVDLHNKIGELLGAEINVGIRDSQIEELIGRLATSAEAESDVIALSLQLEEARGEVKRLEDLYKSADLGKANMELEGENADLRGLLIELRSQLEELANGAPQAALAGTLEQRLADEKIEFEDIGAQEVQDELKELRRRNQGLEQDNDRLDVQNAGLGLEIITLKTRAETAESQAANLLQKIQDVEARITTVLREKEELETKLGLAEHDNEDLRRRYDSAVDWQNKSLQEAEIQRSEEMSKLTSEFQSERTSYHEELGAELAKNEGKLQGTRFQLTELTQERNGLLNEVARLTGELKNANARVQRAESKVTSKTQELEKLYGERRDTAIKVAKERERLQGDLNVMADRRDGLLQELDKRMKEKEELERQLSEMTANFDSQKAKADGLQKKVEEISSELEGRSRGEMFLRAELEKANRESDTLHEIIEQVGEEREELKAKLTETINNLNAKNAEKDGTDETMREARECIEGLREQLGGANRARESAEREVTGLKEQIETLKADLGAADSRADSQRERANTLEGEHDELLARIGEKETIIEGAGKRIIELEQQIGYLDEQIKTLENKPQSTDQNADKIAELEGRARAVLSLQSDLKAANELAEIQVRKIDDLGLETALLHREVSTAEAKAARAKERADNLDKEIIRLREQLRSAEERGDTFQREKTTAQTMANELRIQLESAKNSAEDGNRRARELSGKVSDLTLKIDELNGDLDEAKRQLLASGKKVRIFERGETMVDNRNSIEPVNEEDVELLGRASNYPPPVTPESERPTVPPAFKRSGKDRRSQLDTSEPIAARVQVQRASQPQPEPDKGPEPEKTVSAIFGAITVPKGQHLTIRTLKNIPNHVVSVEDGATVVVEQAFAGATIKLLGPDAKCEIKRRIGNTQKNPIKIIHPGQVVEEIE